MPSPVCGSRLPSQRWCVSEHDREEGKDEAPEENRAFERRPKADDREPRWNFVGAHLVHIGHAEVSGQERLHHQQVGCDERPGECQRSPAGPALEGRVKPTPSQEPEDRSKRGKGQRQEDKEATSQGATGAWVTPQQRPGPLVRPGCGRRGRRPRYHGLRSDALATDESPRLTRGLSDGKAEIAVFTLVDETRQHGLTAFAGLCRLATGLVARSLLNLLLDPFEVGEESSTHGRPDQHRTLTITIRHASVLLSRRSSVGQCCAQGAEPGPRKPRHRRAAASSERRGRISFRSYSCKGHHIHLLTAGMAPPSGAV